MFIQMLAIITVLLFISTLYHKLSKRVEFDDNPPPGKLINVGNGKVHIYGKGQGTPTLIFSCGHGMGFTYGNFYNIFTELAEDTRVVVYDRFGYGWSDNTSRSRTMKQINQDLYELLEKSEEEPPYVLVGHSIGAPEVLQFAQRYPDLVAGVVTIDGCTPAYYREQKYSVYIITKIFNAVLASLRTTGILRILIKLKLIKWFSRMLQELPEDIRQLTLMMLYNRAYSKNTFQETKMWSEFEELDKNLGDIPLLILTADAHIKGNKEYQRKAADSQEDLLDWSSNSKQVIVDDADHYFLLRKPEIVNENIRDFLDNRL